MTRLTYWCLLVGANLAGFFISLAGSDPCDPSILNHVQWLIEGNWTLLVFGAIVGLTVDLLWRGLHRWLNIRRPLSTPGITLTGVLTCQLWDFYAIAEARSRLGL